MRLILSVLAVVAGMSAAALGGIGGAMPASLPAKVGAIVTALN